MNGYDGKEYKDINIGTLYGRSLPDSMVGLWENLRNSNNFERHSLDAEIDLVRLHYSKLVEAYGTILESGNAQAIMGMGEMLMESTKKLASLLESNVRIGKTAADGITYVEVKQVLAKITGIFQSIVEQELELEPEQQLRLAVRLRERIGSEVNNMFQSGRPGTNLLTDGTENKYDTEAKSMDMTVPEYSE